MDIPNSFLNNYVDKPSSSHIAIAIDPGFQDPLLSERTVVFSNSKIAKKEIPLNEEEKPQDVSNLVSHSVTAVSSKKNEDQRFSNCTQGEYKFSFFLSFHKLSESIFRLRNKRRFLKP